MKGVFWDANVDLDSEVERNESFETFVRYSQVVKRWNIVVYSMTRLFFGSRLYLYGFSIPTRPGHN